LPALRWEQTGRPINAAGFSEPRLRPSISAFAEIAVGGEDRRCVLFKRGAHHIEAAQKRIEFLRVSRAKSCGVNRRGFGVGFASISSAFLVALELIEASRFLLPLVFAASPRPRNGIARRFGVARWTCAR